LNISQDLLLRHIEKGYSSEASLEIMTEIREAKETATAINGSTSLQGTVQNDLGTDKPSLKSAYRQATGRRAE
jgi:hypothetical protein